MSTPRYTMEYIDKTGTLHPFEMGGSEDSYPLWELTKPDGGVLDGYDSIDEIDLNGGKSGDERITLTVTGWTDGERYVEDYVLTRTATNGPR